MLRRKSEFFVFLESVRSLKADAEEPREEPPPSAYEEYLQLLMQMKTTSGVSERRRSMILFSPREARKALVPFARFC
ncbi:uncharacterized protein ACO6RY_05933 [Pungitius sinensis]